MTNSERCRRRLGQSAICPRCHMAEETVLHTLHDCTESTTAWLHLLTPEMRGDFFQQDLHSWLRCNLCSHAILHGDPNLVGSSLSLVRAIDFYRNKCWVTEIIWIPRAANKPADRLAKCTDSLHPAISIFEEPSDFLRPSLAEDTFVSPC
ncbi:hypothetical protein V6N11_067670 [Hibiscus sabdariffa]|uniref:RNase H type-1 domain-containing protein n=1 Tax=Hibiscus sabdariffa TaxID=183260 RepID=A0ABR2SSE3_9ROSI